MSRSSWKRLLPLASSLLLLALANCAPAPSGTAGRSAVSGNCRLRAGETIPGSTLVIALSETIDPRKLLPPVTDSERLVFAQLYETLLRRDCEGRLRPGLASSWRSERNGRIWEFTLRKGSRFWDGSFVEPGDLLASWLHSESKAWEEGRMLLLPEAWSTGFKILGPRRFRIELPEADADFPERLVHPDLALSSGRGRLLWRLGTGPFRPESLIKAPASSLHCKPNQCWPEHQQRPTLIFRFAEDSDPRDLLGEGADLFLLRDAEALAYYERVPDARISEAVWDRLYVLLTLDGDPSSDFKPGSDPIGAAEAPSRELHAFLDRMSAELASEQLLSSAVRLPDAAGMRTFQKETRRARSMAGLPACVRGVYASGPFPQGLAGATLLYPPEDPDAKALATRLAFLARRHVPGADEHRDWQASALPVARGPRIRASLLSLAYPSALVLPIHGQDAYGALSAEPWCRPLALTCSRLVIRDDVCGVVLESDGIIRLDGAGWCREALP